MKHLAIDEIIQFLMCDPHDGESEKIIARVNSHIRSCRECLDELREYQKVYDDLDRIGALWSFELVAPEIVKKNKQAKGKRKK